MRKVLRSIGWACCALVVLNGPRAVAADNTAADNTAADNTAADNTSVVPSWREFRGPTGQGHSPEGYNPPLKWSEQDNLRWKTAVEGEGWSSPVVDAGKVFVTAARDGGASCHVICLDLKTGKLLWDREVFRQELRRKEAKNSYATPTPLADGTRVYVVFGAGGFAALDYDGKIVWTNQEIKHYSRHGLGASPRLVGDLLIMPFDGSNPGDDKALGWQKPWDQSFILALDRGTGKEVWRAKRGLSRISHSTPLLITVGGEQLLATCGGDVIQGFEPHTGKLLWTVHSEGESVVPSPAFGDGMLYVTAGFGDPALRALTLGHAASDTPTITWEIKKAVPAIPSLTYLDGRLYAISEKGQLQCLDGKSGMPVWQQRLPGAFSASPIAAAGRIYFLSEEGVTTVVESGDKFHELASNKLEGMFQASPVPIGNGLLLRSATHVYCIGP